MAAGEQPKQPQVEPHRRPADPNEALLMDARIDNRLWVWLQRVGLILSVLGVGGLFACALWISSAVQTAVGKSLPLSPEELKTLVNNLQARKQELAEWDKQFPVGTILPVVIEGSDEKVYAAIPRNWALCDGSRIDGSHKRGYKKEEVDDQFWNNTVPDLKKRYLRGWNGVEKIGAAGGDDSVPKHETQKDGHHSHAVNDHKHGLPGLTGSIAATGDNPGKHKYLVLDDNEGWRLENHMTTEAKNGGSEGQHRHDLGGKTVSTDAFSTKDDGDHAHVVAPVPFAPSYVAVRHIIRIR